MLESNKKAFKTLVSGCNSLLKLAVAADVAFSGDDLEDAETCLRLMRGDLRTLATQVGNAEWAAVQAGIEASKTIEAL